MLGYHDEPRVASRISDAQARVAAMLVMILQGTPFVYYGDEIGMRNGAILPDQVHDPVEKSRAGCGMGRGPERTPMPRPSASRHTLTASMRPSPIRSHFVPTRASS